MSASIHALGLPQASGAYRWYYADLSAGDFSAVCIFMVGSLFSPRYSAAARRGGRPLDFCAVNFALYYRGKGRRWVLSEYPVATVEGTRLRMGRSCLTFTPDGAVQMDMEERCAPWGKVIRAQWHLQPEAPAAPALPLIEGLPHRWQALAPRARARLVMPDEGLKLEGRGYFDSNEGEELLGTTLPRWTWMRTHLKDRTHVRYVLPDGAPEVVLTVREGETSWERKPDAKALSTQRTAWGLRVPSTLADPALSTGPVRLLESSPFYARLEARSESAEVMGEVADFRRFHSPFIRWMAHFRTRRERRA